MYSSSDSVADNFFKPDLESPKFLFLTLLERAASKVALTLREMQAFAALFPNWIHHLSYGEIDRWLRSFSQWQFLAFLQQGNKEAFGEFCRQAYLHGMFYHLLGSIAIDQVTADLIKREVARELEDSVTCGIFGKKRELIVLVDRSSDSYLLDATLADAVLEVVCKKMSHPVADLQEHEEIRQLSKRAILKRLEASGTEKLSFCIPKSRGHGHQAHCDVNFVYDMASFILANSP